MATRLYVGNLSFDSTRESIERLFADAAGTVEISMPQNRDSGQTRGFAYVWMATDADALAAIDRLNGAMVDGRPVRISPAPVRMMAASARASRRVQAEGGGREQSGRPSPDPAE